MVEAGASASLSSRSSLHLDALLMNTTLIGALAALGGSSIGAFAPVLSSYVLQRSVAEREISSRDIALRESLYSDFIKEASRLYLVSLSHVLENLDDLVPLYSLVSRIRLFASEPVVLAAENLVKQIVEHYGDPNLTVEQVRTAALSVKADPFGMFSFACRKELPDLLRKGLEARNHGSTWEKKGMSHD